MTFDLIFLPLPFGMLVVVELFRHMAKGCVGDWGSTMSFFSFIDHLIEKIASVIYYCNISFLSSALCHI